MEHRFCLDEILGKVSEMINDGYHYGSIDVLEDCLLDNGQHGAIMCFVADDEGGYMGMEYDNLEEVSLDEIVYNSLIKNKHIYVKEIDELVGDCDPKELSSIIQIIKTTKGIIRNYKN